MTKIAPTGDKTIFFIADDIRQEIGGKLSILGLYTGNSIAINTEPNMQPVLSALCLFWWFTDGEGEFVAQVSLRDPHGQKILDAPMTAATKKNDGDLNLVIKMSPFAASGFGTYKCSVSLDEHLYEREFKLVDAGASSPL